MMAQFKAVCLVTCTSTEPAFPLDIAKLKEKAQAEDEKPCFDLNTNLQKLEALVRMVHGSLESKPKIIDDFNEQHPECTKNNIEKKLKDGFIKDKRGNDPRLRYYATDQTLE